MFELKLDGGNTHDADADYFDFSEYSNGFEGLRQLFEGEMMLGIYSDKVTPLDAEEMGDCPGDYVKIEGAKWDAAGRSKWDGYIFDWLNSCDTVGEISDLFHGGIDSGITELIWNTKCHDALRLYTEDIEDVLSECVENLGGEAFCGMFKDSGFSLVTCVKCAFEERLRTILEADLQLMM